MYKITGN